MSLPISTVSISSLIISLLFVFSLQGQTTNPIRVIAPNGGETFYIGDTMHISWECDTDVVSEMLVGISLDGGLTSQGLGNKLPVHQFDEYTWVIPDSINTIATSSADCMIKLQGYGSPIKDWSDSVFTIVGTHRPPPPSEKKHGCGSGSGLALIPPILIGARRMQRKMRIKKSG
jgi:hypothetical protein